MNLGVKTEPQSPYSQHQAGSAAAAAASTMGDHFNLLEVSNQHQGYYHHHHRNMDWENQFYHTELRYQQQPIAHQNEFRPHHHREHRNTGKERDNER